MQCSRKVRRNSAVCLAAENSKLGNKIAVYCGFPVAYGALTELNGRVYAPYRYLEERAICLGSYCHGGLYSD